MRPLLSVASVAAVLALGAAGPAAAAPPQLLGQVPFSTSGGCTLCTAVQLTNSASAHSYVMPADGVLTKAGFYVGPFTEASDFVQARAFRKTAGSGATVIGQGAKHPLSGLSAGFHNFFERIPVAAGDVLGVRLDSTPFIEGTPHVFTTGSGLDEAGMTTFPTDPELGDSFTTSAFTGLRVNVQALFEPDEDHDGYGDTSQDLCPGSPIGATACSGSLFGSDMQGAFNVSGVDCTYDCLRVQTSIAGASTAAPFDGVVVRWRLLGAPTGAYRIRVLSPSGGSTQTITASSATESVTDSSPFKEIRSFQTQLSIPAGGYVGLVPPKFTGQPFREPTPGSKYVQADDGPNGKVLSLSGYGGVAREILYDADIEPDADHDGFGDVTQDSCPADPTIQDACRLVSPRRPPAIAGLKATPKRFRIDPGGAVVSRRGAHSGTSLKLRLSEAASVKFTVERPVKCGRPARRGCRPWRAVHSFHRALPAGKSSVPYSGRYKKKQGAKPRPLPPGNYRVEALATNAAGSGAPARTSIVVVP